MLNAAAGMPHGGFYAIPCEYGLRDTPLHSLVQMRIFKADL